MTLYEEGRFLLDDSISKWFPEYADKRCSSNRPRARGASRPRVL